MFFEIEELKSVVYAYQIEQITEADDDIIMMAISAAEDTVKSYLRPSRKKEFRDGRPKYNVELIFSATGSDRSAILLELTKNIAVWHVMQLCNVDMLYENVKGRYDRAIDYLKQVRDGKNPLDLPLIDDTENPSPSQVARSGSRKKFIHE
jgi:hypothetical protein